MTSCCADYCTNSIKKGFRMCRIPRGERRKVWLKHINREDLNMDNCDNMRLCHAHFSPDMWETYPDGKQRCLKANAVPTIFKHMALAATGASETFLGAEGASQSGHEVNFKMNEASNNIYDATEAIQEPVINSDNENTLSRTNNKTYLTFDRCNCNTSQNLEKLLKRSEQLRVKMRKKLVTMKKELKDLKNEMVQSSFRSDFININ